MAHRSRRRAWQLLVMTGALVAAQTMTTGAADAAATLTCGTTITASVTLHADLIGCPLAGLVVAADGITVDLHGHRIAGNGVDQSGTFDIGVAVQGYRGVTITGGTIRGFDAGVVLADSSGDRVTHVDASDNNSYGIGLFTTTISRITAVSARRNHDFGIWVVDGTGNRLEQVTATDNEQGVSFENTSGAVLTRSTMSHNSGNLVLIGDANQIIANVFTDAVNCGVDCGGIGISLEAGSSNLISGNRVVGAVHDGIRLSNFLPDIVTAHNVVQRNTVIGAENDGIAVSTEGEVPVVDSTVRDNIVIGSHRDGIHIATADTDVSDNRAIANAGYGINAVPGVHDGGGNRATANGATPQCLNVTCPAH
jgi:parallel beta-helix repeat protein